MHIETQAIVLKTMEYSESSVIARIFTRELGYRSYIINGVRKRRQSRKAAMYRPMNMLHLTAMDNNPEKLQRVKEEGFEFRYQDLPFNVVKSAIGLFCIEVLHNCINDLLPHQSLYDFVADFYQKLDNTANPGAIFYLYFLIRLSDHLGFSPTSNYSAQNRHFCIDKAMFTPYTGSSQQVQYIIEEKASHDLFRLLETDMQEFDKIKLGRSASKEVLDCLLLYYKYHLENFRNLKSLRVLETVFSPS